MCQTDHPSGHDCECGGHGHTCSCGEGECEYSCHGGHHFERRYQTKAEQIAVPEADLTDLKAEVQAVEEHLADLRR